MSDGSRCTCTPDPNHRAYLAARFGRWGTCSDCPQELGGMPRPDKCRNRARSDHGHAPSSLPVCPVHPKGNLFARVRGLTARRNDALDAWMAGGEPRPFRAPVRNGYVIVHRDMAPGSAGWRATYMEKEEPVRHLCRQDYRALLLLLMVDDSLDLTQAEAL